MILDTHIWIWYVTRNKRLKNGLRREIDRHLHNEPALVSIISCWEISKLVEKGKIAFSIPLKDWLFSAIRYPGIELQELTPRICMEACNLPGKFHGDPADQLLVATSRVLATPIVTMDQKILQYQHVLTIPRKSNCPK